jgi:hypothetical protein
MSYFVRRAIGLMVAVPSRAPWCQVARSLSVLGIACLLGPWLLSGCGTTPAPPPSPRIVETHDGYYRDGRKFPGPGALFWDMELVQGNARAEELFRQASRERRAGWTALGLGILGAIATAYVPNDTVRIAGPMSLTVLSAAALVYLTNRGALHMRDAVNVYNDDVVARERTCVPPAALGGRP